MGENKTAKAQSKKSYTAKQRGVLFHSIFQDVLADFFYPIFTRNFLNNPEKSIF